MREQRLVGGDDVPPGGDRRLADLLRRAFGAADQLDDDVGVGVARHRHRIVVPDVIVDREAAIVPVAIGDGGDRDAAPGALLEQLGVGLQQLDRAAADRAESGDRDLQRRCRTPLRPPRDLPSAPKARFSASSTTLW